MSNRTIIYKLKFHCAPVFCNGMYGNNNSHPSTVIVCHKSDETYTVNMLNPAKIDIDYTIFEGLSYSIITSKGFHGNLLDLSEYGFTEISIQSMNLLLGVLKQKKEHE